MKLVLETIGDSVMELIGVVVFLAVFILCFFDNGVILRTFFEIISKAS